MDALREWSHRALEAVRSGSAWERFDFDLPTGSSLVPVLGAFADETKRYDLDGSDVVAWLYVPLPEEGPRPTLGELSPWRSNLVPQLYVMAPHAASAWLDRTDAWSAPLDDPALDEGLQMRELFAADHASTSRHLVLRRHSGTPAKFDTIS